MDIVREAPRAGSQAPGHPFTPLARIFAGREERMPRAFREQFLARPGMDHEVVLEGRWVGGVGMNRSPAPPRIP